MTPVVRERVRRLERTLHGIAGLPEHGVQQSVAGDQRTYGFQGAFLVAESCDSEKRKVSFIFPYTAAEVYTKRVEPPPPGYQE